MNIEPEDTMKKKMDCYIIDEDSQSIHVLATFLQENCSDMVEIIGTATSYDEAMEYLSKNEPAFLFIDIEVGGNRGFDLLKKCSHLINTNVHVITANNSRAFDAYKYGVSNYLLKPVDKDALVAGVRRVHERRETFKIRSIQQFIKSQKEKIFVQDSRGWTGVFLKEIVLLESDGSYTRIKLENGETLIVSKTLGAMEESLFAFEEFVRVSKMYIVNITHISKIRKQDGGMLEMTGDIEIPISTNSKKEVMDILLERLNMIK